MICGIDEAGRGPLAGPVTAAAVILPDDFPIGILADSKALSEKKREDAAELIRKEALAFGLGWASHTEIDEINILKASLLAMRRAFEAMLGQLSLRSMSVSITKVIVDGNRAPDLSELLTDGSLPLVIAEVKADAHRPAVMAASILAKTARDAEMRRLASLYPAYGYDRHKGYPTREHAQVIHTLGPSPVQRLTFRVPYGGGNT
jgi:ribonuclease HII